MEQMLLNGYHFFERHLKTSTSLLLSLAWCAVRFTARDSPRRGGGGERDTRVFMLTAYVTLLYNNVACM